METGSASQRGQRGFTLIELMVVVSIVAILLAVALPAYQDQVKRGHRSAAKSALLEVANRQSQFLLSNRTYTNDPNDLGYALPSDVSAFYNLSLSTVSGSGVPQFQITLTPFGPQADDGWISVNSEGETSSQFADKWER